MIGREELNAAFEKVKEMNYDNDLPWPKFVESMNFDPNAILEMAGEHGEVMKSYNFIDPAISFGSGFTLALVVMSMQKEKGE